MARLQRILIALLGAAAMAAPAAANDSVASMGTGGLILQRTNGIEMRSEDLYVSAREIRVRYKFYNRTDRDITTLVAFPMPDVTGRPESDLGIDQTDPLILTPFTTMVNGRRAATNVEQRAFLGGVEHTDLLRGLGVPLSPHRPETGPAILSLPRPQIDMLIELGLIEDRSWTDAGVVHADFAPMWTLKTTHYWTQVFPAGREISINHRYTPAIGGSVGSIVGDPEMAGSDYLAEHRQRYCIEPGFIRGAERMRRRRLTLSETWVDYVLTTGANWAEPIGEFRMVVDKGSSRNLVSFCGEGVRKTGPTTFEVRRRNYTPTRDLSVLIVTGVRIPR
jgi:hypothetical protein